MALIDNIRSIFKRDQGSQMLSKARIDYGKFRDFLLQFQRSEPVWKVQDERDYIYNGYLYNDRIYSIIRLLTRNASMIKVYLYQVKDEKAFNRYKAAKMNPDFSIYRTEQYQRKAMEEVNDGHPILKTLRNPNPLQAWPEFVENALGYKYLLGNNYIFGVGPKSGVNRGMVNEMWNLPAQHTRIIPGKYSFQEPIEFYEVMLGGSKITIDAEQVCHLKYWSPDYEGGKGSHYYGVSPIRALARKIQLDNDQTRTMVKQLQSMGIMGMFVLDDPTGSVDLDQEQAQTMERQYYEKLSAGRTMFMNARWRWEQAGMSPVDLAIIEASGMTLRDLCSGYNISSQLLNDPANKTYNNMKDARKSMWAQGILPDYNGMIEQLNAFMMKPWNRDGRTRYVIDFDVESIPDLQEDLKDKITYLKEMYWLTPNQKLEATGWEQSPDPNMDKIYIPGNYVPLDMMNGEGGNMDPDEMDRILQENGISRNEQ